VRVGFHLSLAQAEEVSAELFSSRGSPENLALRDVLWLRAVLIELWRRTPLCERDRFEGRADRLLDRVWAAADTGGPSGAGHTVEHHENR
jgi:hypothetical protein